MASEKPSDADKKNHLIKSDKFAEFINTIARDVTLDLEYRAFIICCVSAGLRVEEALAIKKESFYSENGALYFQVSVLKKRKEDTRWCRVHPNGQAVVEQILREKIGPMFDWAQSTCLKRVKRFFPIEGVCSHSWRHSAVSYYLFTENLSTERTARLVHISNRIVDNYAHLDERATLAKMFQ